MRIFSAVGIFMALFTTTALANYQPGRWGYRDYRYNRDYRYAPRPEVTGWNLLGCVAYPQACESKAASMGYRYSSYAMGCFSPKNVPSWTCYGGN